MLADARAACKFMWPLCPNLADVHGACRHRVRVAAVKQAYNASHVVVIPGSGTYAMEACARQFATGKKAVIIRNGYFSYRWTQILETCGVPSGAPTPMLPARCVAVSRVLCAAASHVLCETARVRGV